MVVVLSGCASYKLDDAQQNLRTTFARGEYQEASNMLTRLDRKSVYKSKDAVLYNLEKGMVDHFAGSYDSSSVHFTRAEDEMDRLYTKSISRGLSAMLLNDTQLAYDGEDYEDIYLNAFKALNYIHLNELDEALVEARRMSYKLERLDVKYDGLVDALSKADTTQKVEWKKGETNIHESALGHFLAAVLYAQTDNPDDARIEYEKMLEAYKQQPGVKTHPLHAEDWQLITDERRYNVLLTAFTGRAPIKKQNDVRVFFDDLDSYFKLSLPSLMLYPSQITHADVVVGDSTIVPLHLIEQMDRTAQAVYQVKEPIIYARAFLRTLLKAAGTDAISDGIRKKNKFLGGVADVLGIIGMEATEKADLRGWQTMPGQARVNVLNLPPGKHKLTIEYFGPYAGEKPLYSETRTIEVPETNRLTLLESLYWN